MGPKRNRTPSIPFAEGFNKPTTDDIKRALGSFPWIASALSSSSTSHEEECRSTLAYLTRKSLVQSFGGNTSEEILQQIDNEKFYEETDDNGNPFWKELPSIKHVEDWIAKYNEPCQSFNEFKDSVLPRRVGYREQAVPKSIIYLLPIFGASNETNAPHAEWPTFAPSLDKLCRWVSAFYGRDVKILPPTVVYPQSEPTKRAELSFQLLKNYYDQEDGLVRLPSSSWDVHGRTDPHGDMNKFQIHGPSFLDFLSFVKANYGKLMNKPPTTTATATNDRLRAEEVSNLDDAIAVVGVTMIDLYIADTDLFLAGYACFQTSCTVLSFSRYHPYLKMGVSDWYDYGYLNKPCSNPNFPFDRRRCKVSNVPPDSDCMDSKAKVEFLRRAGKLILHELGHTFLLPHCFYHSCVMNGSGHIIQDIESSPTMCNICLRKIQFRLGIDIIDRYRKLYKFYKDNEMQVEEKWIAKRLAFIDPQGSLE